MVTSKSSIDKFLSPPITPIKARAVKSFPIGKEWMYEPKWEGFRCLVFRDEETIFLQSRTGMSLTSGFPEIVAAFRALSPKKFVLDGELAWVGHIGQQLDGIVAKRADVSYRPGDDHSTVKIKNYRSEDCVVGGFRDLE